MIQGLSRWIAGSAFAALLLTASPATAQTAPTLGTAETFAVLAGASVSNAGATTITGNLGVSPGTAVTGFPPGIVTGGTIHAADSVAIDAQSDLTSAYNILAGQACTVDLTGQDLGNRTLTPGVYCLSAGAQLTGALTLNGLGNPNAVFIFQIGTSLTTATNAAVLTSNAARVCNVFWQVGASATLGTGTTFAGNILATASITVTTGARIVGRALARNGAVVLDTNDVTPSACAVVPGCPTITVSPSTLPAGTVGVAYAGTLAGSGGALPYTFSATGTLPAGVTLTPAGSLGGTPTAAGSSTFSVRVTDANGCFSDVSFTITIAAAPPPPPTCPTIALSPATLPGGTAGAAFTQTLAGSGGASPYSFGVVTGTLPPGLILSAAGLVSGTPTAASTATVTIRGTDANGCFADAPYTFAIAPAPIPPPSCPSILISPVTLPSGTTGIAYSQAVTGSGGLAPYTFGATVGTLPSGLTLTSAGGLSGTPTAGGSFTFTIRGTDGNGCFGERAYVTAIAALPPVPTLPTWVMVALMVLLVFGGIWTLRRQRSSQ
ncbi:MAG: ice-binding family protein [Acidobacteriota bacterium]